MKNQLSDINITINTIITNVITGDYRIIRKNNLVPT